MSPCRVPRFAAGRPEMANLKAVAWVRFGETGRDDNVREATCASAVPNERT